MLLSMNLDAQTRRYFEALNDGTVGKAPMTFYAPEVIQQEFPNRLMPNGAVRDLAGIREAAEKGRLVMEDQTFEILTLVIQGNSVAVEFLWSGVALVDIGTLPAGGIMKGRFASFIDFRDGLIVSQRSYDCFEPW